MAHCKAELLLAGKLQRNGRIVIPVGKSPVHFIVDHLILHSKGDPVQRFALGVDGIGQDVEQAKKAGAGHEPHVSLMVLADIMPGQPDLPLPGVVS